MFEAVRDVSLRTIVLVAVIVWATLAAIWFLSLGRAPADTVPVEATASTNTHRQAVQTPESASEADVAPTRAATTLTSEAAGRDVVVSTRPAPSAEAPSTPTAGGFVLQVGAFRSEASARALVDRIKSDGFPGFLRSGTAKDPLFRVLIGPYPNRDRAASQRESLKARGIDSFIKELP